MIGRCHGRRIANDLVDISQEIPSLKDWACPGRRKPVTVVRINRDLEQEVIIFGLGKA